MLALLLGLLLALAQAVLASHGHANEQIRHHTCELCQHYPPDLALAPTAAVPPASAPGKPATPAPGVFMPGRLPLVLRARAPPRCC